MSKNCGSAKEVKDITDIPHSPGRNLPNVEHFRKSRDEESTKENQNCEGCKVTFNNQKHATKSPHH